MIWPIVTYSAAITVPIHFFLLYYVLAFFLNVSVWFSDLGLWFSLSFAWKFGFMTLDIQILLLAESFQRVSAERLTYLLWRDIHMSELGNALVDSWSDTTAFPCRPRKESGRTHLSWSVAVRPRAYFYCVYLGEIRQGIISSNEICSLQSSLSLVTRSYWTLWKIWFKGNSVTCLQCAN